MKGLIAGVGVLTSSVSTGEHLDLQQFVPFEPNDPVNESQPRSFEIAEVPIPVLAQASAETFNRPEPVKTVEVPFEALSFCDQLDAIAKGGKSVARFVINSGMIAEYDWAVKQQCKWHSEQLSVAGLAAKNPSVQIIETVVYKVVDRGDNPEKRQAGDRNIQSQPDSQRNQSNQSNRSNPSDTNQPAKTNSTATAAMPAPESVQAPAQACDPSYPDFCIPPNQPSLTCRDIKQRGFLVIGADPYNFDVDRDWLGCE
jgi:hypothetical protein